MKTAGKVIILIISGAIIGATTWWITRPEPTPSRGGKNTIERNISIKAEEEILHYQENRIWNESYYHQIIETPDESENAIIENLDQILSVQGEYNEHIMNANVEFINNKNMTILQGDILGAKSGDWFTFKWLLRSFGYPEFDFYDFQESGKRLFWKGKIENIQTSFSLSFPFNLDHCKAHVWPE